MKSNKKHCFCKPEDTLWYIGKQPESVVDAKGDLVGFTDVNWAAVMVRKHNEIVQKMQAFNDTEQSKCCTPGRKTANKSCSCK